MKRIVALCLLVVLVSAGMISCGGYVTITMSPGQSEAETYFTPFTEDEKPTETKIEPTDEKNILDYWGGEELLWKNAEKFGQGYEVSPLVDKHVSFAPLDFWGFLLMLEDDYTKNVGNPEEYEYKWFLWFKDIELEDHIENWSVQYECFVEDYQTMGNAYKRSYLYRLRTDADIENGPTKNFELGHTYELVIQVRSSEDEIRGFTRVEFIWTEDLAAYYSFYRYFWTIHDKSTECRPGMLKFTEDDIEYAKSIGFQYDEIEKNLYYVKETN